ncbi:MAG: SRPBCC domain-containing protein [Urechidicola sp.]|nr:SRPBCC domain-containing protein [Urechidicola sp.]
MDKPVIVTQTFKNSIDIVWSAITDVDQMTQWFFEQIESFEPIVGFKTQFVIQNEDRIFTHLWKVTEVIPNKKITYNWKYKEYTGDSFVSFELVENNNQVALKLTHTVTKEFPGTIPEFSRGSCVGGWNYFIGERLKKYLD